MFRNIITVKLYYSLVEMKTIQNSFKMLLKIMQLFSFFTVHLARLRDSARGLLSSLSRLGLVSSAAANWLSPIQPAVRLGL